MAINSLEVEFPCGLNIKLYIQSPFLNEVSEFTDVKECPLHGKKCRRNSK